jgi:hypothetical protein
VCRAVLGAEVCVHYSLKWNYHMNMERSYKAFKAFCNDMAAMEGQASIMLVSGGGKKRKLDTVGVRPSYVLGAGCPQILHAGHDA